MNDQTLTSQPERARCEWSDLLVGECAHCAGLPGSVLSIGVVERVLGRRAPQYRWRAREWAVPIPEATDCEHQRDGLCPVCDGLLDGLLADLPHLVEQLQLTLRKGGRFAPHGYRRGDIETPDESPIPWNPAAADVLGGLNRIVADRPQDRRVLLGRLSAAAARAHRVIDRPRDRQVSMCPVCRAEIVIADRESLVVCGVDGCTYSATWEHHQRDLLDANGEALLTAADMALVLTNHGEPMTRARIEKMIVRHGLPRERIEHPDWRDGQIITEPKWMYRVRDVRDLQAKIDARKLSRRASV